jgi:hypothetical protein
VLNDDHYTLICNVLWSICTGVGYERTQHLASTVPYTHLFFLKIVLHQHRAPAARQSLHCDTLPTGTGTRFSEQTGSMWVLATSVLCVMLDTASAVPFNDNGHHDDSSAGLVAPVAAWDFSGTSPFVDKVNGYVRAPPDQTWAPPPPHTHTHTHAIPTEMVPIIVRSD